MEPALLTNPAFWEDPAPVAAGDFPGKIPDFPELRGHVLFETSGSTGTPKWIALSKSALLASARAVNEHLGVSRESRWALALPVRHVGGFGVCTRAYAAGCGLEHFDQPWDAGEFTRWAETRSITHLSLVPTQVHDLVSGAFQAPSSLRAIVVGGGRLERGVGQAARDLGWPVLASFGMTEACSQIATQTLASLGLPYQPSPIPLLPIWQAETSPEGRLKITSPALFSGQLIQREGNWEFLPQRGGSHETRDRVSIDGRCITPLGRADTQVKVLGELVDPELIERELIEISAGALKPGSFAVIAIPDPRTEHALLPVFEKSVPADLIRRTLDAYARQAPGFRRLRPESIVDSLPKSPMGKLRRGEIPNPPGS
jgi:O-succinylbenzoic acid--CoA ligase